MEPRMSTDSRSDYNLAPIHATYIVSTRKFLSTGLNTTSFEDQRDTIPEINGFEKLTHRGLYWPTDHVFDPQRK